MFQIELTAPPDYFDEQGRPCYLVEQTKGLFERQSGYLFEDALAEGYTVSITNQLKQWIADEMALASADRKLDLLEIGGSRGTFFEWVKDSARTYINVDPGRITPRAGDLERWQDPRYAGIGCSAEAIPLEDESVDVATSMGSFDHIPDYRRALSEVSRLLRKDGIFLLTLNNRRWPYLLPISNAIGGAIAPNHGGYIIARCRKRGQACQSVRRNLKQE